MGPVFHSERVGGYIRGADLDPGRPLGSVPVTAKENVIDSMCTDAWGAL